MSSAVYCCRAAKALRSPFYYYIVGITSSVFVLQKAFEHNQCAASRFSRTHTITRRPITVLDFILNFFLFLPL
jgi:hypothetical protein